MLVIANAEWRQGLILCELEQPFSSGITTIFKASLFNLHAAAFATEPYSHKRLDSK